MTTVITVSGFNETPRFVTVLGDQADNQTIMSEMMELPIKIQMGTMSNNDEDMVFEEPQDVILSLTPSQVVAIFTGSQLDPHSVFGNCVRDELFSLMGDI